MGTSDYLISLLFLLHYFLNRRLDPIAKYAVVWTQSLLIPLFLILFNSSLQLRPFLNSPFEELRQPLSSLDFVFFNMLPSLKRAVFVFAILLNKVGLIFMENLPVFVIYLSFLDNTRNTSWFMIETALFLVDNISSA